MNPNSSYVNIRALLETQLAVGIKAKSLQVREGRNDVIIVENAHVEFAFTNVENNYVRLWISSKTEEAKDLGIVYCLHCLGANKILQNMLQLESDWTNEQKVIHYLKAYNEAIVQGFLDRPIAGNFEWKADYDALEVEASKCSKALNKFYREKHPEASPIWKKRSKGDMTWIDDVKRLTSE